MAKMPRPIPGLGKFLSESTVATSVEDHLLTETGLSLRLIAWKIIPIQVATLSLWVSFVLVSSVSTAVFTYLSNDGSPIAREQQMNKLKCLAREEATSA